MISGNKGEWSEFYAFLKLLTEKKLFGADENLEKMAERYFTILKIIREEAAAGKRVYELSENEDEINIFKDNEKVDVVVTDYIKSRVRIIFEEMRKAQSSTFTIKLADEAMQVLHCTQIKAGSNRKDDIVLKVHDSYALISQTLGFSVKSMIGSPSTLLNASKATNFIYKIVEDKTETDSTDINDMDGASKIKDRVNAIEYGIGNIEYSKLERTSFERNLRMIDSCFPEMIAEVIKAYYGGGGRTIKELVSKLNKQGILKNKFNYTEDEFAFKIKQFLAAVALGMTPVELWDGLTKAHGGYIIVREDGELVCYHLYNRDEFQEYLYKNVKLETPSTSRHGYGTIFEENGEKFIKLNLQIRFLK